MGKHHRNSNVAIGNDALLKNTTGNYNTALGYRSLASNTTASNNVGLVIMLYSTTTGSNNTAIGFEAGYSNQTGSGSVYIGYKAGYNSTASNKLYIANSASETLIEGDFSAGHVYLGKANNGKVWIKNEAQIDGQFTLGSISDVESVVSSNQTSVTSLTTATAGITSGVRVYQNTSDKTVALGYGTLSNAGGGFNTAMGYEALLAAQSDATTNTAVGYQALRV